MGMFDYVNFEMDCPKCGKKVGNFQSKDSLCQLNKLDPTEVDTFYSNCKCGNWIELAREPQKVRANVYTLDEVKELGFEVL